jgi:toluene monooxygenase system ferredoxin subunit
MAATEWLAAAILDDVWEGEMVAVTLGNVDMVICNVDGELIAYEDKCPHLANPLSAGALTDNVITCAAHEWAFDARTGDGVNPAGFCLRRYPVRVDGERILVGVR